MVLECVMLVLDNSSYSINGDYLRQSTRRSVESSDLTDRFRRFRDVATRLAAQADAVHIIFNAKCNSNPENEVGLMMMGGKA